MTLRRIMTVTWMGILGFSLLMANVGCLTRAASVAIRTTHAVAQDVARRLTQLYLRKADPTTLHLQRGRDEGLTR